MEMQPPATSSQQHFKKKIWGGPATPIGQNGVAGPPQFFLFFFRLIYLFINYFYDFYYYYFVKDT
jgi:hypothetical protein